MPELVGGSADLTGSVNTKTAALQPMTPETPGGRYIHFGVREHAMAAAMNGMALHGGVIPYGGTFLIFSDYCRPAIRLAALMGQRVIFVLTHDSIGLGEDGPTHQPVEHLAALRAIPDLFVFRPADAVETAECWALALVRADGPSALALTRQDAADAAHHGRRGQSLAPAAPTCSSAADGPARRSRCSPPARRWRSPCEARKRLQAYGVGCAVVSMPCLELFDRQDATYRKEVLGSGAQGRGRGGIAVRLDPLRASARTTWSA